MTAARPAALLALAGFVLGATPAPPAIRHLVYTFTYTNFTTETVHDSGIGRNAPVSGFAESHAADSDLGTISIDVLHVQPDTGLIVSIAEQAHNRRSAAPATCVVYGNTNVVCAPDARVNTEELSVLRLLGSNFIETDQIDSKNHWRVDQTGKRTSDVADFSIDRNDDGILKISSQRVMREVDAIGFVSTTDGTITYDYPRFVPVSVVEDETIRQPGSLDRYSTVRTQTSLTLVQDSAAKKP
jgi:hypothetical protein